MMIKIGTTIYKFFGKSYTWDRHKITHGKQMISF